MMNDPQFAIGIDLGGTNIKGILIDDTGTILHQRVVATGDTGTDDGIKWKSSVYELVKILKKGSVKPVSAIGLSAPGLPDSKNEVIAHMPGRLEGLENFNWSDFLGEAGDTVRVINDGQAALMAEHAYGAGKSAKNIVMLTLGTGVGGGVMIDGRIYQGYAQRAGHLGHICINSRGRPGITNMPGSLEEAIGNESLPHRSMDKYHTTSELIEDYKKGDPFAVYIWLESVRNLSIGISSLINAFSPELILLGGGISKAGNALFNPLRQFLSYYEWRPGGITVPVKPAELDEFAGAAGAAAFARQYL